MNSNIVKNNIKEHYGKNIKNTFLKNELVEQERMPRVLYESIDNSFKLNLKNHDTQQSDEIKNIQFSVFSSNEIIKHSVALINESKLSGEGSIYDSRMGVIQNYNKCVTCKGTNKECPGHFGHIELIYPILHPLFMNQILLYLNLFCSNCNKLCCN